MRQDAKKILKIILVSVLFLIIITFAFFRSRDLIFGVKIRNVNIQDNAKITEETTKITGNARNAVSLSLNGKEISVNQQGDFDETIILLPGYNVVNLKAQDKFGNIDEKNYKLILQK